MGKRKSSGMQLHNEEVPRFRARIANLTGQHMDQLQPLKISRYERGDRFGAHSDAMPKGSVGADRTDFYGDRERKTRGVKAVPHPGGNRFMTVFVYLSDVARGGRTRWRNCGAKMRQPQASVRRKERFLRQQGRRSSRWLRGGGGGGESQTAPTHPQTWKCR